MPRVLAGNDAVDPRQDQRSGRVERAKLGMGIGRTQDRRMERPGTDWQIVAKAPPAAQQIGVFEASDRASGMAGPRRAIRVHRIMVMPAASVRPAGRR